MEFTLFPYLRVVVVAGLSYIFRNRYPFVLVMDLFSKVLFERSFLSTNGEIAEEINTAGWPVGIYFISLTNNKGRVTQKVEVER